MRLVHPVFLKLILIAVALHFISRQRPEKSFYFSTAGSDKNEGSIDHPFKTLAKLNSLSLHPGDAVFLNGGDVFSGNISIDSTKQGDAVRPLSIGSFGSGNAVIDAGNASALTVYHSAYVRISNLTLRGSGRKNGNTKDGLVISNCSQINASNIEVTGFQKSGLLVYASTDISNTGIYAHNNGSAGITVEGEEGNKLSSRDIHIVHCQAVNNAGDPTNLTNHSGDGIVVAHCTRVLIDRCMATENGWDMPRIGNGPVGIWAFEADSVTIEHCLSFGNKTSAGGADGGGFDLDGGVTNSVIQYCFSYGNQGAGYCMFQYWEASPWHHNVIRFNISENDGTVTDAHGGAFVWNGAQGETQFSDCDFYNNTIYNSRESALSYSKQSRHARFRFFNNIFVGRDSLIRGDKGSDLFMGNDWWSLLSHFKADGMDDFTSWAKKYQVESIAGTLVGMNLAPAFPSEEAAFITSADDLAQVLNYVLPPGSRLRTGGIDLGTAYHMDNGRLDFLSGLVPVNGIGACF